MEHRFDVKMTLSFPNPVSGQSIYDALKDIAGGKFVDIKHTVDETTTHTIGVSSSYGDEEVAIEEDINLSKSYSSLVIVSCKWLGGGISYGDGDHDGAVDATKSLRDKLREKLS